MGRPQGRDSRLPATARAQAVINMLNNGECESVKAAVHGVLMATVALCAAYNTAAWLKRRQPHLAINAVVYTAAVWWERCHIVHHLRTCSPANPPLDAADLKDAA